MSDTTLSAVSERCPGEFENLCSEWISAVAVAFHKARIHLVVDCYIDFARESLLDKLLDRFEANDIPNLVFRLTCAADEHLRRDRTREPDSQIGKGGVSYFAEMKVPHSKGIIEIDTTALSVEEVAADILERAGADIAFAL
jgi:chloramphenicol 3-O-phosphotransferase